MIMGRYLVLTPPGAADRDEHAVFIKDGFAPLAFLFPAIWLLCQRAWVFGIAAALLQFGLWGIAAGLQRPEIGLFGGLALGLLVAFEGRTLMARQLEARGWTLRAAFADVSRDAAESLYFAGRHPVATAGQGTQTAIVLPAASGGKAPSSSTPGFGLFGHYGER
ncbi:Protein of unknown function [Rhizobium sp. RU20A]|uniref:DUF2628 domain-containing protein n=1 Tax=Rhizobium sp. RU20A TaxID=1907412 RepID=UPI0009545311|nr:DUF2628 domain-containing protein [Rhizobium sp. RU20A]SIQ82785.1 Protein of unknown function [Rhizobium sp. RU20A]